MEVGLHCVADDVDLLGQQAQSRGVDQHPAQVRRNQIGQNPLQPNGIGV